MRLSLPRVERTGLAVYCVLLAAGLIGAWVTSAPNASITWYVYLLAFTVILIVAGTKAAIPLALIAPLSQDPSVLLFLISALTLASMLHEAKGLAGGSKNSSVAIAVSVAIISLTFAVAANLNEIQSQLGATAYWLVLLILTFASVINTSWYRRQIRGTQNTWWLALVFAPLIFPIGNSELAMLAAPLALIGSAIALHLGARSMITLGLLFALIATFVLPSTPVALTLVLAGFAIAAMLLQAASRRGVLALHDVLAWQVAVLAALAIWGSWTLTQLSPSLEFTAITLVLGYLALIAATGVSTRIIGKKYRARPNSNVDSVLLVIGQLGRGGAEKQVILLANSLAENGVHTTLMSFHGGPRKPQVSEKVQLVILQEEPPQKIPWILTVTPRLWVAIWLLQPQLLFGFLFHAYLASVPICAASTNAMRISARRSLGHFKEHKGMLSLERAVNAITSLIIANSQAVADFAIKQEGLDPGRVKVIYNVLTSSWFTAVPGKPSHAVGLELAKKDEVLLLNVANLIAYKGQTSLLKAIALTRKTYPNVKLRIVGDGPEREEITKLASELKVPLEITGVQEVSPMTYQDADVFVLSSNEEGMSNSLMEAMAAGVPIIATRVGGNEEVLGDTGLLVEAANPEQLSSVIDSLLGNQARASGLAVSAKKRAQEIFLDRDLGQEYLAVANSL